MANMVSAPATTVVLEIVILSLGHSLKGIIQKKKTNYVHKYINCSFIYDSGESEQIHCPIAGAWWTTDIPFIVEPLNTTTT